MASTPKFLYAMHEAGGEHLFADKKGWIIFTEELGHDPNNRTGHDYRQWDSAGYGVICRGNNGYGTTGTLPLPQHYGDFARRYANFVAASPGCHRWQVGNEPNHAQEWPDNRKIEPRSYADAFNLVAAAIHALPGHQGDEVISAPIAPWNDQAGDWIAYGATFLERLVGCGAIGLHAYTHGSSPELITSEVKMRDAPYQDRYAEFRAYRDTLQLTVPDRMRHLPVYLTEMNQIIVVNGRILGWINQNTGWVKAAYAEIDSWNRKLGTQKILCGALYRWPNNDAWGLVDRRAIHEDLRAATQLNYEVPVAVRGGGMNTFLPGVSSGPTPPSAPPTTPLPPVDWDNRLTQRGVELTQYKPQPGEWYWRITKGQYWEEKEHIFAVTLEENGQRKPGVGVRYWWADGKVDKATELKPNDRWMTDFDLHAHGRSYGFKVLDGPSDEVFGMGLGSVEQPDWNIHVSYWFEMKWTQAPAATVPAPPPVIENPWPTPRFTPGQVLYTGGYVNLRRTPGYTNKAPADVIDVLEPGTKIKLGLTHKVADGLVWWGTMDTIAGWVAESDPRGSVLLTGAPPPIQATVPPLLHPVMVDGTQRRVTQPFGVNEDYYRQFIIDGVPLLGHNGVDFGTAIGAIIRAVDAGTIIEQANDPTGYGMYIKIKHAWGETLYAHLSRFMLQLGETANMGQQIGLSGWSGNVRPPGEPGAHLHFGIRVNPYRRTDGYGGYSDPMPYLVPITSQANIKELSDAMAAKYGVDPDLLINLLYAESRFKYNEPSNMGAIGPAQIMPPTWSEWSARIGVKNINNPSDNIAVGAAYLAWLIKEFNGNLLKAILAYNWGYGNVRSGATAPSHTVIYAYNIIHGSEIMKALRKL